jgi:hypothetical protein
MTAEKSKKRPLIIVSIVAAVAIVLFCFFLLPNLIKEPEDYMVEGDYQTAYEKADDDEKLTIKFESIVAENCADAVDKLDDPSSFSLRDAYYNDSEDDTNPTLVLYIVSNNSSGENVSNFFSYVYRNNRWEYVDCVSSDYDEKLRDEEQLTDSKDKLQASLYNYGITMYERSMLDYMEDIMDNGTKFDEGLVKNVNDLFKKGNLDKVKAIDLYE